MSLTYGGGGRVYVTVEERVSTRLFTFTDAVAQRLVTALDTEGRTIAAASRALMSAHSKSGDLAGSLKVKTKLYGRGTSVWSAISAGGTRRSAHAHLFEKGFSGEERVKQHQRVRGIVFNVKAYPRHVTYRAHGYMESSLNARRAAVRAAVLLALDGAAQEKGLAA